MKRFDSCLCVWCCRIARASRPPLSSGRWAPKIRSRSAPAASSSKAASTTRGTRSIPPSGLAGRSAAPADHRHQHRHQLDRRAADRRRLLQSPGDHRSRSTAPLSNLLTIDGDSTHDVEDLVVATKIRVVAESARPPGAGASLCDQAAERRERIRPRPGHDRLLRDRRSARRPCSRSASSATSGLGILSRSDIGRPPERRADVRRVVRQGDHRSRRVRRGGERPLVDPQR